MDRDTEDELDNMMDVVVVDFTNESVVMNRTSIFKNQYEMKFANNI